MFENASNPYQPAAPEVVANDDASAEVSFRLTQPLLRHAEAQYLLRWHSGRLLFGSLVMIAASCIGFWWALRYNTLLFAVTLAAALTLSALIYLAMIHHSKSQIRRQLGKHGLVRDAVCTVLLKDGCLQLSSPTGTFRWPRSALRDYGTRKGMLICPEPLLFLFVPRQSDSSRQAFERLCQSLKDA